MNDFLGFASRAITAAAAEREIIISKAAASAFIHRMTHDEFDRLKVLKHKRETLLEQRKSVARVERQVLEVLFQVGRNLLDDSSLIDPEHPHRRRNASEAAKIRNEIKSVLSQMRSHA
jgi:hypothetical protein